MTVRDLDLLDPARHQGSLASPRHTFRIIPIPWSYRFATESGASLLPMSATVARYGASIEPASRREPPTADDASGCTRNAPASAAQTIPTAAPARRSAQESIASLRIFPTSRATRPPAIIVERKITA